ncbi:hypothetical protein QBC45DRAFT_394259 [Copromyces sp. CBS 386.78]|nr:hypothetical protein QBC45DRAFT_394259 [Copromyces sp. CBS 386.78]
MEDSGAAEEQAQQPNNANDETRKSPAMTPSAQPSNHPSPQQQADPSATTPASAPAPGPSTSTPGPPPSETGADAGSEPVNPRKRKKASRACDFCHVNHQPCDNGQPKCSVCTKHNKPCLYLRPTKRRGPQKGYRTALNTYKESAAAWGAVLGAIPGLDALIEGHLRGAGPQGRQIIASIKDANAQEGLIARWQASGVFKAFFGVRPGTGGAGGANGEEGQDAGAEDEEMGGTAVGSGGIGGIGGAGQPPPTKRFARETEQRRQVARDLAQLQQQQQQQQQQSAGAGPGGGGAGKEASISPTESPAPIQPPPPLQSATATTAAATPATTIATPHPGGPSTGISTLSLNSTTTPKFSIADSTLSDIVAKDAAQSSSRESQTLRPLGFAPDETIADFYSMGSNPDPMTPRNSANANNNYNNGGGGGGSGGGGGGYSVNGGGYDGGGGGGGDDDFLFDSEQRAYYELLMGRSF